MGRQPYTHLISLGRRRVRTHVRVVHAAQAEDLLEMMTDEVRERRFAPFVRLEANESMDTDMLAILMREMKLVQVSVPLATLHWAQKFQRVPRNTCGRLTDQHTRRRMGIYCSCAGRRLLHKGAAGHRRSV